MAKLIIQTFTLWKSPVAQDPTALHDLSISACRLLETLEALDKAKNLCLPASGLYILYSVMVPSHVLLHLLKTSFSRYIDVERAKSALYLGISLHKKMTLQNDDIAARNAMALTQLWNSTRVFKRTNDSEAVGLRVRSRLTCSVIIDGVVWWREEFGGFVGIFPPPSGESGDGMIDGQSREVLLTMKEINTARSVPLEESNTATAAESQLTPLLKPDFSTFMDDPMCASSAGQSPMTFLRRYGQMAMFQSFEKVVGKWIDDGPLR